MATISALGTVFNTSTDLTTPTTAAFTPTAGRLMAAACGAMGTTIAGTFSTSDGITFHEAVTIGGGGTRRVTIFVAEQTSNAVSQTATWDLTGDGGTAEHIHLFEIDGLSRVGADAVRQVNSNTFGSGVTPSVVLPAAALTGNCLIAAALAAENVGITEPSGWTERADSGTGTPPSRLESAYINSGHTSDTITWGSAPGAASSAAVVEFDTTSPGYTIDADSGSYTLTGTAANLEFSRMVSAAAGSYTLSGQDATLQYGLTLAAAAGSYALTGVDAGLLAGYALSADAGSYVLTGIDAALEYAPIVSDETSPTGGAWPYWDEVAHRRRREAEREALAITERQQRRIDRAAVKIARSAAREGLAVNSATIMAAPSFDALLAALQPTEGQVTALADAIMARIAWADEQARDDEAAAILALLAEI